MADGFPFLLPYAGVSPHWGGAPAFAGPGSAVLGRTEIGRGAWLGARSVVRADGHTVTIGDDFHLGARGTVHIAHEVYPTRIGSGVTAGAGSVIHACDVGDRCHVGNGAIILDGSEVAANLAIADEAVVFPRSALEGGWFYAGAPARPVRRLEPGELGRLHQTTRRETPRPERAPCSPAGRPGMLFVAATARLRGRIEAAGGSGVWFGCDLDAGSQAITIGADTNIQDNTMIRCVAAPVAIGREATIGHNVTMTDCRIGDASLIGIGAVVAPHTVVEQDVLLAAGARTDEGQVLQRGWMYGGRPARKLKPLDETRRASMHSIWPIYCEYARAFQSAQDAAAERILP